MNKFIGDTDSGYSKIICKRVWLICDTFCTMSVFGSDYIGWWMLRPPPSIRTPNIHNLETLQFYMFQLTTINIIFKIIKNKVLLENKYINILFKIP